MRAIDADVVVVGAGIAGLTAAWRLKQAGHTVAIMEANSRVGGRIYGFSIADRVVQLGGRWIGPGQDAIKKLAGELGVAVKPLQIFDDAAEARGVTEPALIESVREIDNAAQMVPLDQPWTVPDADVLDGQTLATWLSTTFGPQHAATLGDILTGFLPEPQDVSLLHALFYLKSNGGFAGILGLDGPAHDSEIFVGGAHAMTDKLAERLGDAIYLETSAMSVRHDGSGVAVVGDGLTVDASHAIVTLPPVLAGRLRWDPPLSPARDYLTQRMPIRGKITAAAIYDQPFWRDAGISSYASDAMIAWDEGGDELPAAFTMLVSIRRSREISEMPEGERQGALLDDLAAGLGPAARDAHAVHMVNWAAEPWSRGCNSFMTTGVWTNWGHALREPVGHIRWASAEVSERFAGQMEGAVRTAEAAAAAVRMALA